MADAAPEPEDTAQVANAAGATAPQGAAAIPVIVLPPEPHVYMVREAMIACGFNDVIACAGFTDAQRIATESFDNDFNTVIHMKDDDITSEVKQYASLTQANGKISWTVPQNNKIKVFIFWVQDLHRKGLQPSLLQFLQDETSEEILSHKAQLEHFIKAADQHISALSKCHH